MVPPGWLPTKRSRKAPAPCGKNISLRCASRGSACGCRYAADVGGFEPVTRDLRTRTRTELERLRRGAQHPERIAALMHIIETNQAFHLHKSVERVKLELSRHEHAAFHFTDGPIDIHAEVTRADFERWIVDTTDAIAKALDDTLARAKLAPRAIDCVFMTGGTAFVPAVRRLFEQRFGADKLRSGDELMSIASGLALRAGGS